MLRRVCATVVASLVLGSNADAAPPLDGSKLGDPEAAKLVGELASRWQIATDVEAAHTMDGGYRGMIQIVPALPVGPERKHLEWIVAAVRDFDRFFTELDQHAAPGAPSPMKRFRYAPSEVHFMRSVSARTPSAYASGWIVSWNVAGSLHTSPDAVRETLFHEIFHMNDFARKPPGQDAWSMAALDTTFASIVKRCGANTSCLAPFAPTETVVRGGTYYPFQPGNGVYEYAAELALRYYREQRAALRALPRPSRFKCGRPENARAWALMRDEFFAGVDVVPACGP